MKNKTIVDNFMARLHGAGRSRPARVVDNTAQFPAAAVRRLQMGLPPRPRGDSLDLRA
jgi:hypothetical protein